MKPKIVGILNVNSESFYDGGKYVVPDQALMRAQEMIEEGVDIIEIGGFSTKPGSVVPSIEEELSRILPALDKLDSLGVPLSIDTTRVEIVRAIKKYKNLAFVNDTSGLQSEGIIDELIGTDIAYVLMHMRGTYKDMNQDPQYETGVFEEVYNFLKGKISMMEEKGFYNIIVDPGFFFDKSSMQNLQLLSRLIEFKELGYPLFVGISRKSHILGIEGGKTELALMETCIWHFISLLQGAEYLRVHDVKEAQFVIQLTQLYKQSI